jgi:hypothetical protein
MIIIHFRSSLLIPSLGALGRDTSPATILDEDTSVNLALVDIALVVPIVHHGHSLRRLLRHSELELPTAAVVVRQRLSDCLERVTSSGVPDLECAASGQIFRRGVLIGKEEREIYSPKPQLPGLTCSHNPPSQQNSAKSPT